MGQEMLSYWAWLAVFVFIPSALMLAFRGKAVWKHRKQVLLCGAGGLAFAAPWDYFAIRDGLWGFPQDALLGIWHRGLPLEEWLFILLVTMEIAMVAAVYMEEFDV